MTQSPAALRFAWAAAAALGFSSPAMATGGIYCSNERDTPSLSLVIGHGYPGAIVGATLIDGDRELSTMGENPALLLVQSWVDARQVLVDLSDPEAMERLVLLTVRTINKDGAAAGTLEYRGRKYAVRCGESG